MDGSNLPYDVFVGAVENFNGGGRRERGGGGHDADEGLKLGSGRVMAAKVLLFKSRKGEFGHLTGVGVIGEKEERTDLGKLSQTKSLP